MPPGSGGWGACCYVACSSAISEFLTGLAPSGKFLLPGRDVQAPVDGGPRDERIEHALHFLELAELHQLARAIEAHQVAHPREDRDVGNAVLAAHHPPPALEVLVEHREQALGLGDIAVARALVLE